MGPWNRPKVHVPFKYMYNLELWWALWRFWWNQEFFIPTWDQNKHWIWIVCIWGLAKNKFNINLTLMVFKQCIEPIPGISLDSIRTSQSVLPKDTDLFHNIVLYIISSTCVSTHHTCSTCKWTCNSSTNYWFHNSGWCVKKSNKKKK